MVSPGGPEPDSPHELRDLLAQCIELVNSGGFAAAEPVFAAHPQHAAALRERLRKLAQAGLLVTAPAVEDVIPERLGDFRLVRRLGAGGMGVVYLAVQESLGREVALKLVKPDQLYFPGARDRFRREVEAIARLHDPAIVGIHTVGEEGGIPFFAMERIVGATLAEALHQLGPKRARELAGADFFAAVVAATADAPKVPVSPQRFAGSWVDTCLRIAEEMARALAHAHAQGVLHRDLKPSNVMVTPTGRVALLDFGLAQSRGAEKITRTGAQLGSLHYMAPEQVRGLASAIDERTDVYAVGVVLYELLTLQLPFRGDSTDEVARRILEANPERIVRGNPMVQWDVETVCLTAMDPDRELRYPSASALLRDLRNLLARQPIEAQRPGALLRMRRFAQRHRALTAGAVIAALALVATPTVIAMRERDLNLALVQSIGDRDREMIRARNNLEVASQALNRVLQRVVDEDVDQVPDLRQFTEDLLQETATSLDVLFQSNPTEPGACLTLAETLNQAGNLRWRFRDFTRADAAFSRALQLLAANATTARAVSPERFDFVQLDTRLEIGLLRGRNPEYRPTYLADLQDLLSDVSADAAVGRGRPWRERWAVGLERLGTALVDKDAAAGEAALRRSLAVRRTTAAEFDDITAWLEVAAGEAAFLGLPAARRDSALRAAYQKNADDALRHAATRPVQTDAERRDLAARLAFRGVGLRNTDGPAAMAMLAQAIELYERSMELRPSRLDTRLKLASAVRSMGNLQLRAGQREASFANQRRVVELVRPLMSTWPNLSEGWSLLIDCQLDLVRSLQQDPQSASEVEALWKSLEAAVRGALACRPELAAVVAAAANALAAAARQDLSRGANELALAKVTEAVEHDRRARQISTSQRVSLGGQFELRAIQVEILLATGDKAGALAALQSISRLLPKDVRTRIPGLAAVADEPGFVELLRAVESK